MKIHRSHSLARPAVGSVHPRRVSGRSRAGFSLAELMVVIVILGLLATVVVPNVVKYLGQANDAVAKADLNTIATAVTNFQIQNGGRLPESLDQLIEEDEDGNRFLDMDELVDPWGNDYVYQSDYDGQGDFLVISYGKDGQAGGEGENADITHRDARMKKRAAGR